MLILSPSLFMHLIHHFSLLWVCGGTGTHQSAPPHPAHPGEEEVSLQLQIQREFRLVECACLDAAALFAAVIHTAPPIVKFEGNPRCAIPEDDV